MKPDISVDQYNLPSAAIELHRAGDNQNALALIGEYLPLVQSQSSDHRRDSDVLARAKLADAYRILGKTSESAEMLQSAIDEAMSIPAMQTENVSEARSYLEYFEFQNASQFAKVLIRGKRSEVVSQIALREGDVHVRVDVFVTAAKESFRAGLAEDADRFMHRAAEQAYAALQPFQRSQALMAVAYGYGAVSKISESKATLLEALSAANNIQEAYLSVERLDGAEQKLDSMIGIAAALLDMESLTEGKAVLNEAQALSRRTTKDPSYYLPRFARELALSGQLKMAANVAERVRDGDEQLSAFANVLSGYTLYKEPALRKKLNANKMANAVDDE
jgi:predicted DNA-binding protein